MAQFAPNIVFTDPTMASQLVRLSDLDAAHKNEQQQMAMAAMARQQALAAHQQDQQNRMAYQYAALANQQRAQDLADKRAAAELASRENMFGQQMGLSREGLQLQRDLGLANPYGRAAGDILLGGMQTNNQIGQANVDSETEARNLTAALNSRYQRFLQDYHAAPTQVSGIRKATGLLPGVDSYGEAVDKVRRELRSQYLQDKAALVGTAKHSAYDEASGTFTPVQRTPVTMPGMGKLNSAQPAETPGNTQTPTATSGNAVQAGQLSPYGPGLNSPEEATAESGLLGLQRLKSDYLSGKITPEEYLQQFDGLNR